MFLSREETSQLSLQVQFHSIVLDDLVLAMPKPVSKAARPSFLLVPLLGSLLRGSGPHLCLEVGLRFYVSYLLLKQS